MIRFTTNRFYKLVIFFIIIIFSVTFFLFKNNNKMKFNVSINFWEVNEKNLTNNVKENEENIISFNERKDNNEVKTNLAKNVDWIVRIPEINLDAQISEGTSKEVMDKFVGHFAETQKEFGNVGLAAHNRGYPVNYFQNLKKLKIGSEITYIHDDFEMTYVVEKIEIIENTNWDYLKNTEDNRITLITCVENEPKYRRCIQGIEKIESEEF